MRVGRLLGFAAVASLGLANGGASATSWGWAALAFCVVAAVALIVQPRRPSSRELAFLGGLGLLTGWTALSTVWSQSVPSSVTEVERDLVYLTVVAAALVLAKDELADGVFAGCLVLCGWNLVVQLHGYDSAIVGANAAPVGYANGVGLLGAMGSILALRRRATWPALAVFVPVIVLSGSAGSVLALGCGLVVAWRPRLAPLVFVTAAVVVLVGLQGHLRTPYWNVALGDARSHLLLGSGAGTFAQQWVRHRSVAHSTTDAHSLELQTLAELGILGLALLAVALSQPFTVGHGAYRRPRGGRGLALGAYAAWIVQSGIDWDWQLPAVTVAGLLCGVAAIRLPSEEQLWVGSRARLVAVGAVLAVSAVATVGLVGNTAIARAQAALRTGNTARAAADARRARRWAPWSPEPWHVLSLVHGRDPHAVRRAIALDPDNWELWSELATATTGATARRAAREAARLNPLGAPPASG
jgi:hypothetical protein